MPSSAVHRVLLITTGGTIAGRVAVLHDDEPNDPATVSDGAALNRMVEPTRSYLERAVGPEVIEIDTYLDAAGHPGLCDVDSSDMKPDTWIALAQAIYDNYDDYDSFVITHGTNTLGYTCAALSFAIANSGKPIVLTGSQVPAGLPGSDALTNLENALRIAVWRRRVYGEAVQGVMAVFGSSIIAGTRVKKATEFDYDTFKAGGVGSLGRIGRIIDINAGNLAKHCSYLTSARFPTALRQRDLIIENAFDMNIASLTEFPGMSPKLFATLVEQNGVKGFILRAFGAGDPSIQLRPAFEYLRENRIPIVVTTQAPQGNSNFQVNEGGKWLRDNEMAIPAYDMSIEAQTTKLAWLLAKRGNGELTYRGLCDEMVQDLRGEVRVLWEMRD